MNDTQVAAQQDRNNRKRGAKPRNLLASFVANWFNVLTVGASHEGAIIWYFVATLRASCVRIKASTSIRAVN